MYIWLRKARVTRCHSLVLDKQIRSQLSETVRWLQWSGQLVPKPLSGDVKRTVTQTSSGPRYDACDGARRAEMATGFRCRLARVWEIRQRTAVQWLEQCGLPVWSLLGVKQAAMQWNSCKTGEMCSWRPVCVINLAAAFCKDCSRWSKLSVTSCNTELQ